MWDVEHDLWQVRNPTTGVLEWQSWSDLQRWRVYERYTVHPEEIELIPEPRRFMSRMAIPVLGTDMSRTIEETPTVKARGLLRRWGGSLTKANSRNKGAARYDHFMQATLLKHPKMGAWFNDATVPKVVKEDVKRFYTTLLGELQGKRPEYVLSVLITIAADTNRLNYDPKYGFVEKYNPETWMKYYNDLLVKLDEKLRTFKRPDGSRAKLFLVRKR
jgi:hypothetical protein